MINAPIKATSIKPYMANADSRVNTHMMDSKFVRPRPAMDSVFFFSFILTSQPRAQNDKRGQAKDGNEHGPFDPNGLTVEFDQLGEEVKQRDAQPIDGMEQ